MYSVRGSVWIESNGKPFFGKGRVMLLEGIKKHGSITLAAKAMKMSYRQAWELIDSMNKQSKRPFVIRSIGGVGGGGTKVTKEGEKIITLFHELSDRFHKFNDKESKKIRF